MNNTIEISGLIPDGEQNVDLDYYMLQQGKVIPDLHISMCPGDLYKICNVLWDYSNILAAYRELFPDSGSGLMAEVYKDQLDKIRGKIEKALGYSVDVAHEKCVRNSAKKTKDEGIGEEAMVLAIRKSAENIKKKDTEILASKPIKTKKTKQEPQTQQISIFDVMEG